MGGALPAHARALKKYPGLATFVSIVMKHPMRHRCGTWMSSSQRWLKRFGYAHALDPLTSVRDLKKTIRMDEWKRRTAQMDSLAWDTYQAGSYEATKEYKRVGMRYPALAKGISWLMRARMGAIWMAPRAARAGLIGASWASKCPSCGKSVECDLAHILLDCQAYQVPRKRDLGALIRYIWNKDDPRKPSNEYELAVLCLGGDIGGMGLGPLWSGTGSQVS